MAEEIKTLTSEAVALIEKKMNMTLDDLINDSKNKQSIKNTISSRRRPPYKCSSKNRLPLAFADFQCSSSRLQRYKDSRSCFRQEALAQRQSTFHENKFSAITNAPRKSVFHPARLTAKKVISKPRRAIKWVMGVGYVTPAYNNKVQQNQTEHGKMVPVQKLHVKHNPARREVAVWQQGRDRRLGKFSEEYREH